MHFDLTDIRLLVLIAEANSLTGAAERAHMSLPAVSTRIKNLEESIGVKLLTRTSQGVVLTPAGQAFLHHARSVMRQLEHLRGDLQEYARGIRGHVRIFANTTAMTEFLPSVLSRYLATHPDVNIDLRERLSQDVVRAVSDGTTDIGLVAGNVHTEGLEVLPYRRDRLVLVTAPGHVLANRESAAFDETIEFDFVSLHENSAIHAFLHRAASRLNKPLKTRIEVGSFEAVCRMIESDVGIGVLPESAARRYVKTMQVRVVPLSDEWAVRNLQICIRSLDMLPGFARELVDMLIADNPEG